MSEIINNDSTNQHKELVLANDVLPEIIPILPITQRPVFPGMMIPIIVSGEKMTDTMNAIYKSDSKIGGVVLASSIIEDKPATSDYLYKIGSTVKIIKITSIDNNTFQVMISALKRFTLTEVIAEEPVIKWKVSHYYGDDKLIINQELKSYSLAIISSIKELIKSNSLFQEEMKLFLNRFSVEDPGKFADFVAAMTSAESGKIQEILETFDIKKRSEKVLVLLKEELEMSKLQSKITKQIEQQISKNQKEFFLREQLKQIKQELGLTKDEKSSEIEEYEERIKKLHLTEEAESRISEEIEKIKLLEPRSAEYTVSKNYLDWLTILPWGIYSEDNYEIIKAKKILDRDHYGLEDIKDRILEFISIGKMKGNISGSILCFIGPPGVGKTSIGKSVAEALNRKFYRFSLGGMRDEAEIKGHRRTYIGAMPGKMIQILKLAQTSNPVIMLDEIDKIGASFQGDPASALLEVLDPEQNSQFLDHYIDVRYDLSNILFIATANQPDTIPLPLA